jgi:tetratricopeptide (TPR) repeat protein
MEEFRADIQRYQRNEQVLAQQPTLRSQVRRFLRRYWPAVSIATVVIMFSILFGTVLYIQNKKEQSHWQVCYSERFGGRLNPEEWKFLPAAGARETDSVEWGVKNGNLAGKSAGLSIARLERPFNRDIKVEFDIGALDMDLYNAGFFLFGDSPKNAYGFHINRGGEGDCGITFPGNDFLFQMADPARITIAPVNHVVIEKIQNMLTFSINNVLVTKIWDYLPPLGKSHERLGFFVSGCPVWFDNLKIYRRAIPLTPSPTFVADRFWERGDFSAALEEYRTLLVDFKTSDRAKEVRLKIADCLVRLGRLTEAKTVIGETALSRGKDEPLDARRFFLEGIVDNGLGREAAADSVWRLLAEQYVTSGANVSAMAFAINRIDSIIQRSELDQAEREIGAFINQYSRFADLWSRLSLLVVEQYVRGGELDSAIAVAERVVALQDRNTGMFTSAKTALAEIYLSIGKKEKANDLFNQSITGHLSSKGVWESWMGLAGIYEYDFSYPEAATIYNKIFRESPKTLPVEWMAAVKLGELATLDSTPNTSNYFEEVARGVHPFPVPRLIARFYLGQINEAQFKAAWNSLFPGDYLYLYYFARKAMFTKEKVVARIYLDDLKKSVSQQSWSYYLACKVYNNLEKWK